MLSLKNVTRYFGGLTALNCVNLEASAGQVTGLIGPNGAGKTTLINNISGLDHPNSGQIIFNGHEVQRMAPHRITALGLARTYQNIRLFNEMTVLENVMIAQHFLGKSTLFHSLLQLPSHRKEERFIRQKSLDILEQFGLSHLQNELASNLSYGDQRRLEMARALAADPKMVLLDEPTAGMNAVETEQLGEKILDMKAAGIAVLVVEHDMALISQVCDIVYVLNFGEVLTVGTPDEIKRDPAVIEAYLGRDE
ncbi:MAG: ABC transporter ATP-binding protein [Phototrophicales bacterium]|nr:MAG: ABC transporter ATP-binding protein [Phototrophicales bacterium]